MRSIKHNEGLDDTSYYSNLYSKGSADFENPVELVEQFLSLRYEFRHNLVSGQLEFRSRYGSKMFIPLRDRDENELWREIQKDRKLQEAKVPNSSTFLRTILQSGFSKEYDPLKEYFMELPQWDQKRDHIAALASTVETDNDKLFHRFLEKWLVAMVASVLEEKTVNQTVLVFSGKQGIGKTSWILNLVPKKLRDYVFSGTINPNNKDTLVYLSTCLLINLDELENMNNTEIGALKETITKPQIKLRRPYGRNAEDMPRRASFAGSVNSNQFLNDSTGSRRFLCFEAKAIDYKHKVNMELVFAQAYALYLQGYKHWLDQEEIAELEANNSKFQRTTVEEDLLLDFFEPAKAEDDGCMFYSTTQLADHIASKVSSFSVNNSSTQKLGKALRKNGFKPYKRDGIQKYAVLLKQVETKGDADTGVGKAA
ncbi:VapE domain-containing protein [Rufibacter latericius]|uniref:Virulence-associated e family protein n=1 Tax=Rufibacter latericius TaxID=2487040 RepID=A0A3M9MMY6_9BACT|nr:VapE domain-containing protein [Rufibacter latericius]RNI26906.1 virulence-associated e family protein [Rufibacter latericius]